MQQSPLEKLVSELYNEYPVIGKLYLLDKIKSLLPYEKQYLRDVAEKAISNTIQIMQDTTDSQEAQLKVESYLNQNYLL